MKMTDNRNAQMNSLKVRSSSSARPETAVVYAGRKIHLGDFVFEAPPADLPERSRARPSPQTHLSLAIQPVDSRRCLGRDDLDQIVEPRERPILTRDVQSRDGGGVISLSLGQAELYIIILIYRLVTETRDPLVTAHHNPQRAWRCPRWPTPRSAARVAIDFNPQLRLVEPQRRIGIENPSSGAFLRSSSAYLANASRSGPRKTKSISKSSARRC